MSGAEMNQFLFGRHSWPFVFLGGLLAAACLASIWYINRLQADLARAVRHDASRMEAADELQVQLRHLRFHTLAYAADPSDERLAPVLADVAQADAAIDAIRSDITAEDEGLVAVIEHAYEAYKQSLGPRGLPPPASSLPHLVRWSDDHPMRDLLKSCRDLSDRQRARMDAGLARSEAQTAWAGRVLLGLGLVGAFGGLVIGYATARGQRRRAAQLSVRVQAVQTQLDQEVGAVTVELPPASDVDEQLDRVIGRVREVCRRLQEQERDLLRAEQLAAVGQLAAGVAHEVRNPLTGIKFLVEGALRAANPIPLTGEDLRLIRQEIVRMERTVQGLLDFARMPPPDRRPHDMRVLVAEAAALARGRAEQKPVAVQVDLPDSLLPVSVDRDHMLSLLSNLIFNAIDATPPEGRVGVRTAVGHGGIITVEVTDTGPGINPLVANRLFTPFVTTKPTGTGLGLTVARRVARDHGGTLTAANRPEGGACFTFTLPSAETLHAEVAGRG
jgi:two-component system, NtrC family, sensor histidine kinase HydH